MYLKLPDVYPYQPTQLRAENPHVSFPSEMADALLAEFGVYPVQPTRHPSMHIEPEKEMQSPLTQI